MFCTQCGNKVDEKTHICLNCGCYVTKLVNYKNLIPTKKIELKVGIIFFALAITLLLALLIYRTIFLIINFNIITYFIVSLLLTISNFIFYCLVAYFEKNKKILALTIILFFISLFLFVLSIFDLLHYYLII